MSSELNDLEKNAILTYKQKISKSKFIVIHDSDYKNTRQSKIKFSTKYLDLREEIKLMLWKNLNVYSRNIKTIFFVFLCPIIMLTVLNILDYISLYYIKSTIIREPPSLSIDDISLNCNENKILGDKCLSIGIATIVYIKI
jgi:hypothetical protein